MKFIPITPLLMELFEETLHLIRLKLLEPVTLVQLVPFPEPSSTISLDRLSILSVISIVRVIVQPPAIQSSRSPTLPCADTQRLSFFNLWM